MVPICGSVTLLRSSYWIEDEASTSIPARFITAPLVNVFAAWFPSGFSTPA